MADASPPFSPTMSLSESSSRSTRQFTSEASERPNDTDSTQNDSSATNIQRKRKRIATEDQSDEDLTPVKRRTKTHGDGDKSTVSEERHVKDRVIYIQKRLPSDTTRPLVNLKLSLSSDWTFSEHNKQAKVPISRTVRDKIWTYCLHERVFSKLQPGYTAYLRRNGITRHRVCNIIERVNQDGWTQENEVGHRMKIAEYKELLDEYLSISEFRLYECVKALIRKINHHVRAAFVWVNPSDHSKGCDYVQDNEWMATAVVDNGVISARESGAALPVSRLAQSVRLHVPLYNGSDTNTMIAAVMEALLGIPQDLPPFRLAAIQEEVTKTMKNEQTRKYLTENPHLDEDDILEDEKEGLLQKVYNTREFQTSLATRKRAAAHTELVNFQEKRRHAVVLNAHTMLQALQSICADNDIQLRDRQHKSTGIIGTRTGTGEDQEEDESGSTVQLVTPPDSSPSRHDENGNEESQSDMSEATNIVGLLGQRGQAKALE